DRRALYRERGAAGCHRIPATEPFAPGATSTTQCPVRDGREMPRKTALLLLALALAVAACGGGGESASSTEPGEEPSAEPTSAGEEDPQPLAAFFGWDNGDPAATEARLRDQEARDQESIRRCMAEQGSEEQPVLPPDDAVRVDATSE